MCLFQIEEEQEERGADRLLFSFLTLITKLSKHCGLLELSKPHDTLTLIWGKGRSHHLFVTRTSNTHTHTHTYFFYVLLQVTLKPTCGTLTAGCG